MDSADASTRSPRRPVLLVGSVPLDSARSVFKMAGDVLGNHLTSVPDGETGIRTNWIGWQGRVIQQAPFLEALEESSVLGGAGRQVQFGIKGTLPADARFSALGYAEVAEQSYREFKRSRDAGELAPGTLFQVCLPSPAAPMAVFVTPPDIAAVQQLYERAMKDETAAICKAIPRSELSLQWDVATEFAELEGLQPGERPTVDAIADRIAMLAGWVPEGVTLGYHFCYGDASHKHFKEPESTGLMVDLANALFARAPRRIDYLHMPVPRGRIDDAYYAPLKGLCLPDGCTLFLGLIHRTDGLDGTKQRIASAERHVACFGVATECGWGRRPPETVPELMQLNAAAADL